MKKSNLQYAAIFSIVYFLLSMFYSYILIYSVEIYRLVIILFLTILTLLTVIIFLYFKRFLKYYYNFKDHNRLIYWLILMEILHNSYLITFYNQLNKTNNYYYIAATIGAVISALMFVFYMSIAAKLLKIAKKSTRLMLPFAWSFFLIPIIAIVSFTYSIVFQEEDIVTSFEYNNTSLLLSFLKAFPFLFLTLVYYRAYIHKHKHQIKAKTSSD